MGSAKLMNTPYELLRQITDGFSEERIVGSGSFGVVYKGMFANGEDIAVKVLRVTTGLDDKDFINEFQNLARLEHQNIVELVSYCNESEKCVAEFQGKEVVAEEMHTALCFEFVRNGSLDKYISDENDGLDWHIRYKIIKGICEGLKYLNEGLESPIWHLDLKPENILLDNDMIPKIADFGLSRLIGDEGTRQTLNSVGTLGYWPPEYVRFQLITKQFDVFSLGVILTKIMMGTQGYYSSDGMQPRELVKHVHNRWRRRLRDTLTPRLLEPYCQQVKICIEIASKCLKDDRHKRPTIQEIVFKLNQTEAIIPRVPLRTEETAESFSSKSGSTNLKELPGMVEKIGHELIIMNDLIKQMGTSSLTNEFAKGLVAEMRNVVHCIRDVMDKYSYHSLKLEEENIVKKIIWKSRYFAVFNEISEEIIKIEKRIEFVTRKRNRWLQLSEMISANPLSDRERKLPQDYLLDVISDDHDLVGIEETRRLLTQWLYSDGQSSKVITVSGMGGLGKTTLVQNVYEREKFNFNVHVWIVVSQTYNVVELLRKLVTKIGGLEQTQVADLDAHDLKAIVMERLKYSNCLIVLDDVWNKGAYTHIRHAFRNLQARVIITTRLEQVASLADPTCQLNLKPVEHSDAFTLFCRKAFYKTRECKCPQELENLASNIVDRCQGLPLAIASMGGLLSALPPDKQVWNETYRQLRNELTNNDPVRAILNLSYHDLPGDQRNCFFYCSLFPEDHQFSRDSLVRLWTAEGFALQKEQSTAEEVADRYLTELIQRNMIEVVEKDELGRVSTCKMHDLVRELALSVAKEEKFGFASDLRTMVKMDKGVRRLSSCGWNDETSLKVKFQLPRLRTLVAVGIIASSAQLLSSVLSESIYLTVLELQDSEITEIPASIGNLFNLRYIGLRRTHVKSLPESIGKLSNLHTLDIKQTKIEKLPRSIVKIKKLRHLLADTYADEKQSKFRYFIGMQPPKELSNLDELQTLETVEASKDLAEQLRKLTQLRSVWIDNIRGAECGDIFAALSKMPFLSTLLVSASDESEALCLEALKPESENLHRLIIRGCWTDKTLRCPIFLHHGKHLKYLALSWCSLHGDPLQLLAPHLLNLTYLSLNRVSSGSTLVLQAGSFPLLKTLVLKHMNNISEVEIRDGALPQIEGLYIVILLNLSTIPQGIESLRSLKKLWLLRLHHDFKSQWDECGMTQKMQYVPELRI